MNNDDDDGDQIIDREDNDMVDAAGLVVEDNDLAEVRLNNLPAILDEGTVTLEVIQGQEQIRIWDSREKRNLLVDNWIDGTDPNQENPTKQWIVGSDVANLGELPKVLFIEGVKETDSPDNHVVLVVKYLSANNQEFEADRLHITVVGASIVPDYNRNGLINDDDRNRVTEDQPWRFWVNDDNDGGADAAGIGTSGNDLPGQNKDNSDNQVNTIRDLLDFFPLYLDLGNALQLWPHSEGYRYILKDKEAVTANDVKLGIFEAPAALTSDRVYAYLEELAVSDQLSAAEVKGVDAEGVELSAQFLDGITASDKNGIILVEGRATTVSPLSLEIGRDGKIVHSVSFPLEIVPVEEMFGHKNLRTIAGAMDGDPDRLVEVDPQTQKLEVGDNFEIGKEPYCMQGVNKSLVWMHGYNVGSEAARGTYAEVFKRFFHAGLVGRFYGVTWFGNPPALGTPHYHQAVVNAFATAGAYKEFVSSVPGSTSIAAHSLGNMVAGSAIQDQSLIDFVKYFAVDAAVALEAYGQVIEDEGMINVDDWLNYWQYEVLDANGDATYPARKLFASKWHELFTSTDNRSRLTWRNRLLKVSSDNVYNFYSSTEDVLRSYPGDDLFVFAELLDAGLKGDAIDYLATSTWVKQEKFKGRRSILNIADNLGGVSSSYCGWSFNNDWYGPDPEVPDLSIKQDPSEAALIEDSELISNPFFDLPKTKLFGIDLADLISEDPSDISPSDFVMKYVSETPLADYYTKNMAAHGKVVVRDWLLAEAFPATTLPMGANENSLLRNDIQNVDMSGDSSDPQIECCKTSEALWPRASSLLTNNRDWRHSDYKDVPYQHTFNFFKNIKGLMD
jgi:hypothetical protein